MSWYWILVIIVGIVAALYILACLTLFFKIFGRGRERSLAEIDLTGTPYEPYSEKIRSAITEAQSIPYKKIRIERDCSLIGYYYDFGFNKTVIMFHGYRATPLNNFAVACKIFKRHGFNVLMTVQRGHGESGGRFTTFGVRERNDCLAWINYVCDNMSPESIVLYGVSMGSFSLMCISDKITDNRLKALVCDCGYVNAYEEISFEMKNKLGGFAAVFLPTVRLFARIIGGFDLAEDNACAFLSNATLPVFFLHGKKDKIVPFECTEKAFSFCASEKSVCYVEEAGHVQSFLVDEDKVERELFGFLYNTLK